MHRESKCHDMRFILKPPFSRHKDLRPNFQMHHMIQLVMSVSIESIQNFPNMNNFSIKSTTNSRLLHHTSWIRHLILMRRYSLLELWMFVMIILITSKLDEFMVSLFDIYPLSISLLFGRKCRIKMGNIKIGLSKY